MGETTVGEIFTYIGGGSIVALAVAMLKFIRDSRDTLRDIRKELGNPENPNHGVIGKVFEIERELKEVRDWAVRQGYDQRKR